MISLVGVLMVPSTKGVVDVVFCLDASASMAPCLDALRRNIGVFLESLTSGANRRLDCRLDFLAHSCDPSGILVRSSSLRKQGAELIAALYGQGTDPAVFFTTDTHELRRGLSEVSVLGDEAMLVALDMALDYPWRPKSVCHRVVVLLTDEPLEANAEASRQLRMIGSLIDKIHALGIMLFLVGPKSAGYEELAEADKCQYQLVHQTQDGLGSLDFTRVLSHIGKSVSVATLQRGAERGVRRALFGQDRWVPTTAEIQGGK